MRLNDNLYLSLCDIKEKSSSIIGLKFTRRLIFEIFADYNMFYETRVVRYDKDKNLHVVMVYTFHLCGEYPFLMYVKIVKGVIQLIIMTDVKDATDVFVCSAKQEILTNGEKFEMN